MPISVVIFQGPTPELSRPILATHDPDIVRAVRQLLLAQLSDAPAVEAKVLPLNRVRSRNKSKRPAADADE